MTMKTNFFLIVLLVAAVCLPFGRTARLRAGQLPPGDTEINGLLDQYITAQRRAPGIVVAIIDTNGTRIFAKGVSKTGGPKVNGDTLFEIGSITKTFTATLLQGMVDDHEVQLEDPIGKYLPASVKTPSRNGKEITLLDLATQSSGLPRLPANLAPEDAANPYADYTVNQMYAFLSQFELKRDIGRKYEYSNYGVGLLGHILALRAGTNYEALVVQRICDPLHMDGTRIALSPGLQARFATGHDKGQMPVEYWDIPALAGCGALRSTANDLAKFVAANMGKGSSPLVPVMKEAQKPRRSAGRLGKIGILWMTDTASGTVWHNGGTYGFSSYVGFKTDGSLGVVVLSNSGNGVDDVGQRLLGDRADLEDFAPPTIRKVAHVNLRVLDDFVGKYKFSGAPVTITMTRDGDHLFGQMTGQGKIEFFPQSETEVFCTVVDAQMTFVKDDSGKVTHLVLHQNGLDQKVTKVK